jgi:hypothetical protein
MEIKKEGREQNAYFVVKALGLAQELRQVTLARPVKAVDHHVSLNGQRHEFMKQVNQQR